MYYLVAGAAALAVLEQRLVAARRHGRERRQVHVLEPAGAACTHIKWSKLKFFFSNREFLFINSKHCYIQVIQPYLKNSQPLLKLVIDIHMYIRTVVVGAGAGGRAVPGGSGGLPVGVGGEGGGVKVHRRRPSARTVRDEEGEDHDRQCTDGRAGDRGRHRRRPY